MRCQPAAHAREQARHALTRALVVHFLCTCCALVGASVAQKRPNREQKRPSIRKNRRSLGCALVGASVAESLDSEL